MACLRLAARRVSRARRARGTSPWRTGATAAAGGVGAGAAGGGSAAVAPSLPPRDKAQTDGAWDAADARAVQRAQRDAAKATAAAALLGRSADELKALAVARGEKAFRGKQLHDALYRPKEKTHARIRELADAKTLPAAFRLALSEEGLSVGRAAVASEVKARDGTAKLLLKLSDGFVVEAVGIPTSSRLTVCVSSQVGCPMRCTFCATGKGGFARNLSPHEIVDQVITVEEHFGRRATNIVFMGMGEPLLNLRNTLAAHRCLNEDVGIGARNITISTVGVPNAIAKLAEARLQSTLAVSLHAPNQELRERLIPSAKAYPFDALLHDCQAFFETTGRRVTFEYTLLAGENDLPEHADELAALLNRTLGRGSHVNLIPYNPVDESDYQRPSDSAVKAFADALERRGVASSVRQTRGLEAAAACGQLRNRHQKTPMPL